jgi:hypothetical protein
MLSLTSALDVDGWLTPHMDRFNARKETQHPLYSRLGGLQGQSVRVRKILSLPGFDRRTVYSIPTQLSQPRISENNIKYFMWHPVFKFGQRPKKLDHLMCRICPNFWIHLIVCFKNFCTDNIHRYVLESGKHQAKFDSPVKERWSVSQLSKWGPESWKQWQEYVGY